MPVRFRNQVNTTPSPHIVVKKERKETRSAALSLIRLAKIVTCICGGRAYASAGIGTPLLFTQPKIRGACPSFASESNMRELA